MNRARRLLPAVLMFALCAVVPSASLAAAADPAVDYPLEHGADAGDLWKDKLGLSGDQVRKLTALENEKTLRLKPLRELLRNGMVKVQSQLAENAPEADVQDSLLQLLQLHRAIAERSERLDAGLSSFLTPSQRAKLLVWRTLGGLNGYAARRLDGAARLEPRDEEIDRE